MIKTLYIARTAMLSGNDNAAILNYHEVASLFMDSAKLTMVSNNVAICYNNIACIHAKKQDFKQ